MMEEVNKKAAKSVKKIILNIFSGVLIGFVVLVMGMQIYGQATKDKNGGVINYGNFSMFRVLTDSMEPEYKVDTMLFVKKIDPESLKVDDVITFRNNHTTNFTENSSSKKIITHRIAEIVEYDGQIAFWTIGDNLFAETCPPSGCTFAQHDWVLADDIIGVVVAQNMVIGKINVLLEKPIAMFVLILIPIGLVFVSSLKDLFKQLKQKEVLEGEVVEEAEFDFEFEVMKEKEKMKLLIELEKEKFKKELEEDSKNEKE